MILNDRYVHVDETHSFKLSAQHDNRNFIDRMFFRQAYSVSVWLLSWLYFINLTAVPVLFLLYATVFFIFLHIYLQLRFVICILYNKWMNEWNEWKSILLCSRVRCVNVNEDWPIISTAKKDGPAGPSIPAIYITHKFLGVTIRGLSTCKISDFGVCFINSVDTNEHRIDRSMQFSLPSSPRTVIFWYQIPHVSSPGDQSEQSS